MLISKMYLLGTLLTDVGAFAYSSDEIYWFKDNDFASEPNLIAKVKNIQNVLISLDNTYLIVFNTTGGVFKVYIKGKIKPKKYALSGKPNGARIYLQNNKFGITADIRGNIFGIDFENDLFWKTSCDSLESYYAIFPSVEENCFLMQGVDDNDNTFMRKYRVIKNDIQLIDSHQFGDVTLIEHKMSFKCKELIYFIECIDKVVGLYSYNEITQKTEKHFTLAKWDDLWKILACYKSLNYSDEYKCFVVARTDKIQLFDIDGNCIKEFCIQNGYLNNGYSNAPYDAYILNDKLYINTIIGVYEEALDLV